MDHRVDGWPLRLWGHPRVRISRVLPPDPSERTVPTRRVCVQSHARRRHVAASVGLSSHRFTRRSVPSPWCADIDAGRAPLGPYLRSQKQNAGQRTRGQLGGFFPAAAQMGCGIEFFSPPSQILVVLTSQRNSERKVLFRHVFGHLKSDVRFLAFFSAWISMWHLVTVLPALYVGGARARVGDGTPTTSGQRERGGHAGMVCTMPVRLVPAGVSSGDRAAPERRCAGSARSAPERRPPMQRASGAGSGRERTRSERQGGSALKAQHRCRGVPFWRGVPRKLGTRGADLAPVWRGSRFGRSCSGTLGGQPPRQHRSRKHERSSESPAPPVVQHWASALIGRLWGILAADRSSAPSSDDGPSCAPMGTSIQRRFRGLYVWVLLQGPVQGFSGRSIWGGSPKSGLFGLRMKMATRDVCDGSSFWLRFVVVERRYGLSAL